MLPLGTIDDSLEITDRRLSEDQDVQTHINTAGDRYSGIKLCEQRTFETKKHRQYKRIIVKKSV